MNPRGPLSMRRMSAHWVVLAAAALTTLVAAAVGAALAAFAGQALPQAVRHDLVIAPGALDSPQLAPLWSLLSSDRFQAAVTGLGGYSAKEMGRRIR